jgi:hypothetical protein
MSNRYQRQQAFQNPEESATVLHAILLEKYGEEVYDWDPVTVALEVQADFQCEMCSEAVDRWCAISTTMASNVFFTRLDAFLGIVNTLNSGAPAFDAFDPSSVEEIAWAVVEVALNREMLPFSYTIRQYVKKLLAQDGYDETDYPEVLRELLDRTPDTDAIRAAARTPDQTDSNKNNIEAYIDGQMADMIAQFDKIQDLKGLDDLILARGLDEAMSTRGVE